MRMRTFIVALFALALSFTGCATADTGTEAGFGLPRMTAQDVADAITVPAADRAGALDVASNGCFHWSSADDDDGAWIVWPEDAEQDADVVVLGSGERIGADSALTGRGRIVELADLPAGGDPDSYFGSFGRFCGADSAGVLVLEDVAPSRG